MYIYIYTLNKSLHYLYRPRDVGKPKVQVASDFIKARIPDCHVVPYPLLICLKSINTYHLTYILSVRCGQTSYKVVQVVTFC